MNCEKVVRSLCLALLAAFDIAQAGPCTSKDVPIRITIEAPVGYDAALRDDRVLDSDPARPYVTGQDGVQNTVLHYCSGDVTLGLQNTPRKIGFRFPAPIPGSDINGIAPSNWEQIGWFQTGVFFNVNNVLWAKRKFGGAGPFTFTTRMTFQYIMPPGAQRQSEAYTLRFQPPDGAVDTPIAGQPVDVNTPYQTSYVTVEHTPGADCTNGQTDRWVIKAVNPSRTLDPNGLALMQVGTLYDNRGTGHHAGQYEMPFQITVTALACVPD